VKQEFSKNIITVECEKEFQVRFLKEDGVGLLTTKSEKNYLILDSLEYWYDLIQNEYPKKKKCSCKNEWFYVQYNYLPRLETDDIREVQILTTCKECNKTSKAISIDIDYSPTQELIDNPIVFCEKPNIKYKFKELTSYWTGNDLKTFLQFIFTDLKLNVYCWFDQHSDKTRRFEKVSLDKAIQITTVNHRYLNFYFSKDEFDTSKYIKKTINNDVYIDEGIWRRNELVQLAAPIVMLGYGVLFYINYCNQYLDKGEVADKSQKFENLTTNITNWLKQNFVTKRGKNCFDGQQAYEKFEAKRNAEKNASS
jgi:hypothetical protein